jgi:hypothetical protein
LAAQFNWRLHVKRGFEKLRRPRFELVDNPTSQALRDYFRFDRHSGVTGNYPQAELH